MSIVNQTVPRALSRMGYSNDQVAAVVAYVDEHKSIVGAPDLDPSHLPVFACSMGDNAIHYTGHVRMLGAVQPFISGSVSKTVNLPEQATIEEVEQLHIDAWHLGIKAIAIYRDNCKVAQPLATTKSAQRPRLSGRGPRPGARRQGQRAGAGPPASDHRGGEAAHPRATPAQEAVEHLRLPGG